MTFEGVVHVGDMISFNGQTGIVESVGVRTTKLKWFNQTTIVRNNELKNYIQLPAEKQVRVTVDMLIGFNEDLEHVESILENELPLIHENLSRNKGKYNRKILRSLNRELILMCNRNNTKAVLPQVVVSKPSEEE